MKMSMKNFLYIFVFVIVAINGICAHVEDNEVDDVPEYHMLQGVKVYQGDRQCVLVGGLCVHSSDCNEPTTTRGLCPTNSHRGVECCYELKNFGI
ncbi:uncharacterized protein LOC119685636 isoform X2 [Teleopsis dalmanni]|uniref:uncharacterized protein LOC119685636 isoform X2 n=1 Tax=Teleopsis dalmanni TaxID=139649 RepID=UPI0018CC82C6|nr:uncharacterized protein LOC119685636 isoform X2 [Teleopsis dalmanni]